MRLLSCQREVLAKVYQHERTTIMGKKRQDNSGKFSVLPRSASLKQHMVYMKKHTGAIIRSLRVDLGSPWCLG